MCPHVPPPLPTRGYDTRRKSTAKRFDSFSILVTLREAEVMQQELSTYVFLNKTLQKSRTDFR